MQQRLAGLLLICTALTGCSNFRWGNTTQSSGLAAKDMQEFNQNQLGVYRYVPMWASLEIDNARETAALTLESKEGTPAWMKPGGLGERQLGPVSRYMSHSDYMHIGTKNINVPIGWVVNGTVANDSKHTHFATIVAYSALSQAAKTGTQPLARPLGKISKGVQQFRWKASRPGQYAVMCTNHPDEILATLHVTVSQQNPHLTPTIDSPAGMHAKHHQAVDPRVRTR